VLGARDLERDLSDAENRARRAPRRERRFERCAQRHDLANLAAIGRGGISATAREHHNGYLEVTGLVFAAIIKTENILGTLRPQSGPRRCDYKGVYS
jgi:hypothetical protein